MISIIIIILCTIGSIVSLIAAIGILRMPDFYMRLSVTVKASTLGVGLILISAALYFKAPDVTNRTMAIVLFLILTAPVAGHMIGRSAYQIKTKLWKENKIDELEGMYEEDNHLRSEAKKDKSKEKINEDEHIMPS